MTDLVKQLNTHFCEELNTAWLKCCKGNGVKDWTVATFRDICRLLAEAREQGYQFNLEYSPNLFIEERIIGKDLEAEFCTLPEWEEVGVVINSLRMAEDRSMDQMIPRLQELKSQYLRPILLKYAITCSREHGPFFAGPDNSVINIFGFCGSAMHEIMLLTILYMKK
jgi:hypothetical protein